ncbi:hypothetical protein [Streptacidiphilus sp. PAMC 29251]
MFLALAGSISQPSDVAAAEEDGEMYALLCPVTLDATTGTG